MDKLDINGEHILNRLLNMLNLKNIKQKDFFAKIGISKQGVSRWKEGSFPSIENAYLMANELDVSLDWLITGNEKGEDSWEETSPAHIVNRIEETLEQATHHKVYELDFNIFESIKDIIDPHELNNWRDGKRPLDTVKLCKIADRLGVSVQYLMTGTPISKEEYTHYYGSKESAFMEFYRQFHNLNPADQEHIKATLYAYFMKEQLEYRQKKAEENKD